MANRKQPRRILIGDKYFEMVAFLIHTKDEHGRPALCKVIPDDHVVNLAGGEEFMVGYVTTGMMTKRQKGQG